jgi:outer membrane receptor protein involved in Fe transport
MAALRLPLVMLGLLALPAAAQSQAQALIDTATVTVTGKKEAVVKKLDKTVYDVTNMARAANGSAQDVLQATPDVSVTADGQIAVKGSAQVTVLVDGKPTAMLSGTGEARAVALQTMSGADIASVEVITNPSAAYNANGGAILNIVLKRNRKPGAHAQVQGSASDRGLWHIGTSGDVTGKQVSVHGNLALRHDGTEKFRQSAVEWTNPLTGATGETRQTSDVFVRRVVASAALGVDVDLSDLDTLSLSTRYNDRRSRPLFDVLNDEHRSGADRTLFHRISEGPNTQSDASASLGVSHHDGDQALKATVQHSETTAGVDKSYRDVYLAPLRASDDGRGATRSARRLDQATLDFTRALARGPWSVGLDLQDKIDDMRNYQAAVDPSSGTETPDPATTNGYTVRTTTSAAYLTDQATLGQWQVLLGGRAERMALRVHAAQLTAPATHWQAFNPSLHIKYAVGADADLTLAYRRSLQMPDPRDLNPFSTYVDAQNLSRGNPNLAPQRLSSWEVGGHAQAAHLSGDLGAFYRTSRNTVTDARTFADDVLVTSKQNGGQARSAGITGALDWTPDAVLHLGADGGVYRVLLDSPDLAGRVHQAGVSGYVNLRAGWRIGRDDVALDAHGQSAGIAPLGRFGPTSSINVTWKHALGKTLSLTVNGNDLFDGSRRSYATDTSTLRQTGFDHFVARRIYVGLVKKLE